MTKTTATTPNAAQTVHFLTRCEQEADSLYLQATQGSSLANRESLSLGFTRFVTAWRTYLEASLQDLSPNDCSRRAKIARAYYREHLSYLRLYAKAVRYELVATARACEICRTVAKAELPRILFQKRLVHFYQDVRTGLTYLESPGALFELIAGHDLYESVQDGRSYLPQAQKTFLRHLAALLPSDEHRSVVFAERTNAETNECFLSVQAEIAAARLKYLDFWRTGEYRAYPEVRIPASLYYRLFCPREYRLPWLLRKDPVLRTRIAKYNPALSAAAAEETWAKFVALYRDDPQLPTPPDLPVKDHSDGLLQLRRLLNA